MGEFHPYFTQKAILISPPVAGSHATTATKELVAAVAGKKNIVTSLTLSTLIDTTCLVQLTDGSGGDVLYEIELQASLIPGVSLSNNQLKYFQTSQGNALHLKLGTAQKVTYSLTVVQDD